MKCLKNGHRVIRLVITGGPCSGKTTAIDRIIKEFSKEGHRLLVMPETATQLIGGGISPASCMSMFGYQRWQLRLQLAKEEIYNGAAGEISEANDTDILIICDRGMLDNAAYVTDEEFEPLLAELNLTKQECLSWYDAVFHLTTTAKGVPEFYTLENNRSRYESPEEAAALDDRLLHAWGEHPRRYVLDNSTGFEEKLQNLIGNIRSFLHTI